MRQHPIQERPSVTGELQVHEAGVPAERVEARRQQSRVVDRGLQREAAERCEPALHQRCMSV